MHIINYFQKNILRTKVNSLFLIEPQAMKACEGKGS